MVLVGCYVCGGRKLLLVMLGLVVFWCIVFVLVCGVIVVGGWYVC